MNQQDHDCYVTTHCCEKCGRPFPPKNNNSIVITFRTIQHDDNGTHVTPREQDILEALLRVYPETLTIDRLFSQVWGGYSHVDRKILDVYIHKLRPRLQRINLAILNARGVGYKLAKINVARSTA